VNISTKTIDSKPYTYCGRPARCFQPAKMVDAGGLTLTEVVCRFSDCPIWWIWQTGESVTPLI